MAQDLTIARAYFDKINGRSASNLLTIDSLTIERDGNVQICYAPFDHIEKTARLVIVGITPGMTQAVNALNALHSAKLVGRSFEEALRVAKMTASFSGLMRTNLIEMLDFVGIAQLLQIDTSASLFDDKSTDMHFTSALRYPVFIGGNNYTGKQPDMMKSAILRNMIDTHLAEEAKLLPNAVWLPLGPTADRGVSRLIELGHLNERNVLRGMPHPSKANNERVAVFTGRKSASLASKQTNSAKLLLAASTLKKRIAELDLGEAA